MFHDIKKSVGELSVMAFTLLICITATAQSNAIKFRNISFEDAMTLAKKTHKIIFTDVEGSKMHCRPCEEVKNKIFTVDSIANFFNKNCINIKVDMNSSAGSKFAPRLKMLMYPVYIFYDENGDQLEFTNSGSVLKDPMVLMGKAQASISIATIKRENTRSITFNDESWNSLLVKAKEQNKLIFLDAYTSWCRPCMMMASDVFTLDKVADFYNTHFINVSMDMEKGEGPTLVKKYTIWAYPAFLFINGNGKVVFKGGGYQDAKAFINLGEKALKTQKKTIKQIGS